jgi:aquaporin Z
MGFWYSVRPLWVRLIIEFLGTFLLVSVAVGAGVINHYAGGEAITRAAAVIAPGALVMALIYAWGRSLACISTLQ